MPFVRAIRKWVASKKRGGNRRRSTQPTPNSNQHHSHQQSKNNKKDSQQHQHNQHQQQHPPFDSPSYMPKSWMNFHFKKKDLYQAIDQSFRHWRKLEGFLNQNNLHFTDKWFRTLQSTNNICIGIHKNANLHRSIFYCPRSNLPKLTINFSMRHDIINVRGLISSVIQKQIRM